MFNVFADFHAYKSGIYHHVTGDQVGRHDVKVVGWGVEGDVNYWIAANSWGSDWGEQGYFRIKEGEGEFENDAKACIPDVSESAAVELFLQ